MKSFAASLPGFQKRASFALTSAIFAMIASSTTLAQSSEEEGVYDEIIV